MATSSDRFSSFGAELNKELGRTDGEFIAKALHCRLEHDLTDWFYDRVFRIFDGIPESEWSKIDQSMAELRARNEVSCFQAIETAIIARESRYLPAKKSEWFADWCLRLNLGVGAPEAKQYRLPHYLKKEPDKRGETFSAALAEALPETPYAYYLIVLYTPLLLLLTKATVATAFNDHATARATTYEHNTIDSTLQTALNNFITGGGVCYNLDKDGRMLITESKEYGQIYYVWTTSELAEKMRDKHEGSVACACNYRELHARLSDLKQHIQSVAVDFGGSEPAVVPIDKFIEIIENAIRNVDRSDFGVAYYNAVGNPPGP
jgi:hypothetical protein